MNIRSIQSGHWTDDELLATIYGIGPENGHLAECAECASRLKALQSARANIEQLAASEEPDSLFLAAQRRAIYARLSQPAHWWNTFSIRRWAAGVASVTILCGGAFIYNQNRQQTLAQERVNDAKLMQEVAAMADDSGSQSMAPLQALFE
jgi:hypothetical protein